MSDVYWGSMETFFKVWNKITLMMSSRSCDYISLEKNYLQHKKMQLNGHPSLIYKIYQAQLHRHKHTWHHSSIVVHEVNSYLWNFYQFLLYTIYFVKSAATTL